MSVLTFGVALGVSGLFALLSWKAHEAISSLRANLAVEAFFDPGISSEDASAIAEQKIDSLAGIARVTFISKEQALTDYSKMSGENVESVLGMNPLPASVKLTLAHPTSRSAQALEASLRAVPGIQDVRGNFPIFQKMESRSRALDTIAIVLSALLLLSAFFYAVLAGRHGFEISLETLHTFRLLGATRLASVSPILLASTLAGGIGGMLGWGLLWAVHAQALSFLESSIAIVFSARESLAWLGLLTGMGLFIGTLGAAAAALSRSKPQ